MTIDLEFRGAWSPPEPDNSDLGFGKQASIEAPSVEGIIAIVLSGPAPKLQMVYQHRVSRKLEGVLKPSWQLGNSCQENGECAWQISQQKRERQIDQWKLTQTHRETNTSTSGENAHRRQDISGQWRDAIALAQSHHGPFISLKKTRLSTALSWQELDRISQRHRDDFIWLISLPNHRKLMWQITGQRTQRQGFGFSPGLWKTNGWHLPWQIGRKPKLGISTPSQPPESPVTPPNYNPDLNFNLPASLQGLAWRPLLWLEFGGRGIPASGIFAIPILKVYFVSHTIEVVRRPGRDPIPVKSLQISIDADTWAWGFSASLPYKALEMIEPTASGPVEIEITLDGVTWVMLVEGYETRREFGQSSLSIRGRSLSAYLAEPYAMKRSFAPASAFTARQLAEQELARSDAAPGFSLDWRLPDWLIPGGIWNYDGLTPMAAMGRIVESVGGYIAPHAQLKTLIAQPRYPELPWHWDARAPDRRLPLDIVKTLNLRWEEKPFYNGIYVSGERAGITGRVTRSGSAGDVLAPMIIDGLITHADAARERGRSVLANVGKQAMVTLELPMISSLGLIDPGQLIAIGDGSTHWKGLVRSTRINADWSDALTIRQTLEVERHYL